MEEEEIDRRKLTTGDLNESSEFNPMLMEVRPFRPFKTGEEYLYAMKEDLAEWLNSLYGLQLNADDFLEQMETGVILGRHANNVMRKAREYYRSAGGSVPIPDRDIFYRTDVLPETFLARDNISNFISWCRSLEIKDCLLFETDDLVLRKNERSFILCLLEVARRGAKFGMPAPLLVQLEQEIDAELANDDGYETTVPVQVVTNDLRSLHERVVELLSRCTCPSQFPMIRVADGKYRIGDTKVLIFVRILRSHVMVRVGGGWDTLEHYLDKHDPCRCKSGHRLATSAKLTMKHEGKTGIPSMHISYNRPQQPSSSNPSSPQARRRSIPRTSPMVQRKSSYNTDHNSAFPPPLPPSYEYSSPRRQPCSDDSSASNSSLQERQDDPLKLEKAPVHSGDSSSEATEDESLPPAWNRHKPVRRRKNKKEFLPDTVPSSWQYSPVKQAKENKLTYVPETTIITHRKVLDELHKMFPREQTSRLPSLTRRSTPCLPPVENTGSHHTSHSWTGKRSQSSEDLFQEVHKQEHQPKPFLYHSRGSSPVNMKGLNGHSPAPQQNFSQIKKEMNFRRADPVRHSYHHAPRPSSSRPKRSPSSRAKTSSYGVIPEKQSTTARLVTVRVPSSSSVDRSSQGSGSYKKVPPTSQDKCSSPVLEKLLQHSELCSDETFLKKMEMLITEFLMKKQSSVCCDQEDLYRESSLSTSDLHSSSESRKMPHYPVRVPKESNRKSPSKIPLPTWYLRCNT